MKLKIALICGLSLAGANAMACYTVYNSNNRVVYQGVESPVDMSVQLHESVGRRFGRGASMVFNQSDTCTPVSIAQVERPAGRDAAPGTIRMERSGRTAAPTSRAPLLTDQKTAERQNLPHRNVAGNIVVVPAVAAAKVDLPTFTVIPSDPAVARAPAAPDTNAMGAGRAPRDRPMTIPQRGYR
jgi:hypothetical protein